MSRDWRSWNTALLSIWQKGHDAAMAGKPANYPYNRSNGLNRQRNGYWRQGYEAGIKEKEEEEQNNKKQT